MFGRIAYEDADSLIVNLSIDNRKFFSILSVSIINFRIFASNATHRFTYNSVAKAVDIKSPDTIKSYIDFVEDTYLV